MEINDVFFRFGIVFVLTMIYGLQRQRTNKPVGFGTFILVAVGACGMSLTAIEMGEDTAITILGAIITGIGFLGAGALIKTSDRIFGFTTAATIWLFAIFGMIVGLGYYQNAMIMYVIVWIVIGVDKRLEKKSIGSYRKKLKVSFNKFIEKKEITATLSTYCKNYNLINMSLNKKESIITFNYQIEGLKEDIGQLFKEFYNKKGCVSIYLE